MNPWLALARVWGMGFYVAGCIILGIWGGHWLDAKYHTGHLWLIVGTILGIFLAVYGSYNMLKPFLRGDRKDKGSK